MRALIAPCELEESDFRGAFFISGPVDGPAFDSCNSEDQALSHIVSIQTEVRDPVAIRLACCRLKLRIRKSSHPTKTSRPLIKLESKSAGNTSATSVNSEDS